MLDDLWRPDAATEVVSRRRYSVTCRCGNKMRVKPKHFGRMCRCTQCRFPIYVTYDNVEPPVSPGDRHVPRVFKEDEVPVHWQKGDRLMELYEVRETLGEGGMGVVYHVYHRGWGKHLAVKSPAARLLGDEDWLDQFEHECETWINLPPHPNVVECYYVRRLAGIPRVFVEFVKGRDLGHLIDSKALYAGGEKATLKRMLDIAIQFCWGLHHAHQHGVVHQDVKPGNLLVSEGDECKVTDFGLAKVWVYEDGSSGSSKSDGSAPGSGPDRFRVKGLSGGTPTYRSADHKLFGEITHKADMWSWGVSVIEMFSGDVYWRQGSKAQGILDDLLRYGSRYDIVPKMPERLQDLLYACFQEHPDDRPPDMQAIADQLRAIYKEEIGKTYLRKPAAVREDSLDVLNNRAVSLLDLDKSDEAERLWDEVLEHAPEHVEALYNKHLHYWKTGRITDAQMVELMYQLTEAHQDEWLPPYLLARVLIERGDATTALKLLGGVNQTPDNKREINYGLAMAQNYSGRDRKLTWEVNPGSIKVTAVALSFDGWRALTGGLDGQIRMWEVPARQCTAVFNGHTDRVHAVVLSEEEHLAVSASADKTLRVWAPMSGKCLQTLKGHIGCVRTVSLTPNGQLAVSGSDDGSLMLWETGSGKRIRIFQGHRAGVNSVAVSRCGTFVCSASSDGTVKRWNMSTGECMHTFEGCEDRVTSLALSQDGTTLLSACDRYLYLWDVATGELKNKIRGHTKEIFSVCLNETGRYAISATGMGTIKIWDIASGQCLRSFQGHAPLALSRDGHFAISGGKQGEFKIWTVCVDDSPFPAQYFLSRGA